MSMPLSGDAEMRQQRAAFEQVLGHRQGGVPGLHLLLADFEAGQRVDALLLRSGQPFAVVVGFGADRLPVLARQPDHFQQMAARCLPALRLDHRPVDVVDQRDEVGDAPFRGDDVPCSCRRLAAREGPAAAVWRCREQHVERAVEGVAEIMRQPEIGLRHEEFGIALQPDSRRRDRSGRRGERRRRLIAECRREIARP